MIKHLIEPVYQNENDANCLSRCNSNINCVYSYFFNGYCYLYDENVSIYLINKSSITNKFSKLYKKQNLNR